MSVELWNEIEDGMTEIYEEIGFPMTYISFKGDTKPDKFGNLIPEYDEENGKTIYALLNVGEIIDKDTNKVMERTDGELAIITKSLVVAGIIPKQKDLVIVTDMYGNTLRYVVTGLKQSPSTSNVGIPFIITYLQVAISTSLARA